jgi:hypothetical protein
VIWYLTQVGIAFDMQLNAILGGVAGQTISLRMAQAALRKVWAACVFCKVLSWLVQRDHCADQLGGKPMNDENYFRAFVGLVVLAILLGAPGVFVAVWLVR